VQEFYRLEISVNETSQIREIPKEMRVRLPAAYHSALETKAVLKKGDLHKSVMELVISYKQRFDITFPPLNEPLILFRHVRDLCLPGLFQHSFITMGRSLSVIVDIYAAVQRMAKILDINFSFPTSLGRQKVTAYPENQIISLVVIATKLSQPFDDIRRVPASVTDPTTLAVDWEIWLDVMQETPSEGLQRGEEMKIDEQDVLKMDGRKLDDYLDWFQKTWVDDNRDRKG
jgi:RNA polymerase I-specific transcription initiation factor RRN7